MRTTWSARRSSSRRSPARRAPKSSGCRTTAIVISCKVSGVQDLIAVYRNLAARCDYPLHLGLTEAGMGVEGHRRLDGRDGRAAAGRHRRHDPRVADAGAGRRPHARKSSSRRRCCRRWASRSFSPLVVACPGCGRTTSTYFQELAQKIQAHLRAAHAGVAPLPPRRRGDDRRRDGLRRQRSGREQARQHRHQPAGHGRASGRAGLHRRREGPDAQGRAHRGGIPGAGRAVRRVQHYAGSRQHDRTTGPQVCRPARPARRHSTWPPSRGCKSQIAADWSLAPDGKAICCATSASRTSTAR